MGSIDDVGLVSRDWALARSQQAPNLSNRGSTHALSDSGKAPANAAWPAQRIVAFMPGSLPMGGVVPETPIHAFATTPPQLRLDAAATKAASRHEIELGGFEAFLIDEVVTPQEAGHIIEASECFGYREEAPGISTPPGMRMNKSVHWVADEALLGPIMQRIAHLLPSSLQSRQLHHRLSHRLNMYRYDDQDVFNRHIDGDWPGYGLSADRSEMVEWEGLRSAYTMLLYLNDAEDGVQGGCTRLIRRGGGAVDVQPRKGSALFFRHGFGPHSVPHEGRQVLGPVAKYVARINVMYELG